MTGSEQEDQRREAGARSFEKMTRKYCATPESDAAIPRRPPALRDDGGAMWSGSDRPCDDDFFQSRPDCDFRIISASGGDCRRAGLLERPKGLRGVRISSRHGPGLAERDGYTLPIAIIFPWDASQTAADQLNSEHIGTRD